MHCTGRLFNLPGRAFPWTRSCRRDGSRSRGLRLRRSLGNVVHWWTPPGWPRLQCCWSPKSVLRSVEERKGRRMHPKAQHVSPCVGDSKMRPKMRQTTSFLCPGEYRCLWSCCMCVPMECRALYGAGDDRPKMRRTAQRPKLQAPHH